MILIITFLTVFILYYSLRLDKIYNYRKYQIKLYIIRDKLRQAAIEKKINKNDWSFHYLDSSISKSAHSFRRINIWFVFYLVKVHKSDDSVIKFKRHLDIALAKNQDLKSLYEEYNSLITQYVIHRHIVLLILTGFGLFSIVKSIAYFRGIKINISNSFRNLTTFPEISTSSDFGGKSLMIN